MYFKVKRLYNNVRSPVDEDEIINVDNVMLFNSIKEYTVSRKEISRIF